MSASRRAPGMMDVARYAGVSHQTVSRVVNGSDAVRPATREKVQRAIEELGYRRNLSARALVTRRSRTIGVIVAESNYHGPGQTSSAIRTAARAKGYATLVAAIRDTTEAEVSQAIGLLLDHAVEGIVAISPERPLVDTLHAAVHGIPLVLVADGLETSDGIYPVSVDQFHGAVAATEHLIGLGHRSIVHVSGPPSWFDANERVKGWRDALQRAGLPVPEVRIGDWSADSGYEIGQRLVADGVPDAVFCSNDLMALGLLSALAEHDVAVPDRVSLVGYDDISGAQFFQPPLTSVRQPFAELGAECVEVLVEAIGGGTVEVRRVKPALVVRTSTVQRAIS